MSETRPLLRDLITIPERVQTSDFVLKLAEGISDERAAATIRDYVVTPQLAKAFDAALGIIQGAVEGRRSVACYLHGSFGSGKSHFMAVLDLLLGGNQQARAKTELAATINAHDPWLSGKRFLMVPYHMIGQRDLDSAVLGGYAEHVRRLHPNAPVPGFYLGERLFEDARGLRTRMGDDRFFAQLNAGKAESGDGWGDLGASWDVPAFDSAVTEPPEGEARQRLVGDLISTFFGSYGDVVAARGEAFVDLDTGLAIVSRHAQALGYDAVVLFLDELILWLATRAADTNFVASEAAKLSKLVEAQHANRPVPIISFVARQRDLRELVGEHQAGALHLQVTAALDYFESRFDKVTLEDRNLPVIAEKRLLAPRSEAAKQQMDDAFEQFAGRNRAVLEMLLGTDGERELFRKTYPFSPALVQALIAASSVLQRERTALKLMLTLLVKRRDDLRLGGLIPVGDLWDEISSGDQPFSDGLRIQFENAKKLWTQKLLVMLEQLHGITWQDLNDGRADPGLARNFANDARLLKTLLLAALVPDVAALRALTAPRLAALNHGSVLSPVPGKEGSLVLQKLRNWAARVGEIRISDDSIIPTVSLQITGIDVEPILANANQYDNDGTRRSRLQKILFEALELAPDSSLLAAQGFVPYEHPWRGTRRPVDLHFESVRDLNAERLRGRRDAPVLVLGLPFDPQGRPPSDHLARARDFDDADASGGVVWQPSYLSDRALKDLGTLVRIDFVLAGDRLNEAARMLSLGDREQARAILKSQQSALYQRLRACLEAVYGVRPDADQCVGTPVSDEEKLVSLDTFAPRIPVGATMKIAVGALLDRWFEHRYPAHPQFEAEVKTSTLRKILERVQAAAQQIDQRLLVTDTGDRRDLAALAMPLRLGTMSQTHFVLSNAWAEHFARMHARAPDGGYTVGKLRAWMNEPSHMGLTQDVQNLVVLSFAAQADRTLVRHGAPAQGSIERIDDAIELREQLLPDEATWATARARASNLFGLTPREVRKGTTLAQLADDLKAKAAESRPVLHALAQALKPHMDLHGIATSADRLVTLRSAQTLLAALAASSEPLSTVTTFASADLATSEAAVRRCLGSAAGVRDAVGGAVWSIINQAVGLADQRQQAAAGLRARLVNVLQADEHVVPLKAELLDIQDRASRLLADSGLPAPVASVVYRSPHSTDTPAPAAEPKAVLPWEEVLEERMSSTVDADEATRMLETLRTRVSETPDARLTIQWRLTRRRHGAGD